MDVIDATILKELLKNGRKSFTEIAKKANTSKDIIAKRYKRMKKKGIIVGATIQNSCACRGGSFIASINVNIESGKTEQTRQLIQNLPKRFDIYRVGAGPNLLAMVILKTIAELDEAKQLITKLPAVLKVDTTLWTGVRNIPDNLSIITLQERTSKARINSEKKNHYREEEVKFDKINLEIIDKLSKNSRTPFSKIAADLKISTDTVVRRYEKLKRKGHIKPVIQINPTKIGYNAYALFYVTCHAQNEPSDIIESSTKIPDVNFIGKASGNYDFMIIVMIRDIKRLVNIQKEISNMKGVTNIEIVLSEMFSPWPLPRESISTV